MVRLRPKHAPLTRTRPPPRSVIARRSRRSRRPRREGGAKNVSRGFDGSTGRRPAAWARASFSSFVVAGVLLTAVSGSAQVEPSGHEDDAFDFMNLLARHGLHDIKDEAWNAYGQFTWISSLKLPFSAPYSNVNGSTNSLVPDAEHSFTGTATFFLGIRLWQGAEAYLVPEVIAEQPLSNLKGLGGAIQNFELQKGGTLTPLIYRSRAYLQQTIGFGGTRVEKTSDPMQLGTVVDSRRLVLRAGNFSILDFFDKNSFSGDLRRQFFNMAFLTYAAYDFAADARGYAYGAIAELYYDDWVLRIGRMTPPVDPNQLPLDFRIDKYYGDQAELEHSHRLFGQAGAVRILGYRNRENMARFDDAIAMFESDPARNAKTAQTECPGWRYDSQNVNAPDLCWARRPNVKVGIGINLEQHITDDIGVFFRGMISDGMTEVYSFSSTDQSISFGALVKGSAWRRPADLTGVGVGLGWISQAHADYLRMGGIDGFIGDGNINPATESVVEAFYSANVVSWLWLSVDYQHITNPAFNADRGPVDIFGARIHAEF
jgi:high affinity Mn2+ porin